MSIWSMINLFGAYIVELLSKAFSRRDWQDLSKRARARRKHSSHDPFIPFVASKILIAFRFTVCVRRLKY